MYAPIHPQKYALGSQCFYTLVLGVLMIYWLALQRKFDHCLHCKSRLAFSFKSRWLEETLSKSEHQNDKWFLQAVVLKASISKTQLKKAYILAKTPQGIYFKAGLPWTLSRSSRLFCLQIWAKFFDPISPAILQVLCHSPTFDRTKRSFLQV